VHELWKQRDPGARRATTPPGTLDFTIHRETGTIISDCTRRTSTLPGR